MNTDHDLPLLGRIAGALRWLETLLFLISGPVLTVALGISIMDLVTRGSLLRTTPALLMVWAVGIAVGVDAQLVGAWDNCRQALRRGAWWSSLGYTVLGLALGYIAFLSVEAFSFQQSFGVTEDQALARLGISPVNWTLQRAALAVALVALSGFNRYHPPSVADSAADERERLTRELELEPMRAELRARKAIGWRGVGKALAGKTENRGHNMTTESTRPERQPEETPPDPPEPPMRPNGHENSAQDGNEEREESPATPSLALLPRPGASRRPVARKTTRDEARRVHAFALLDHNPEMTKTALGKALRCRQQTANALYAQWAHGEQRKQVASR